MPATTLATIASFQMILFCKAPVTFGSDIKISFLKRNSFLKINHNTKITFSLSCHMFVIVNKYILAKQFDGIVLWPFIFVKRKELKNDPLFMNHERIHVRQQLELLIIFFFIFYLLEYLMRLIKYKSSYKAYTKISFEREAYANETNMDYLKERKTFGFLKYM